MTLSKKTAARLFAAACLALATTFLSACSNVSIAQQGLVSKPNVALSDEPAFLEDSALIGQTEPGSGTAGGAAGGCVSCK